MFLGQGYDTYIFILFSFTYFLIIFLSPVVKHDVRFPDQMTGYSKSLEAVKIFRDPAELFIVPLLYGDK